jgi:hypothetical protein
MWCAIKTCKAQYNCYRCSINTTDFPLVKVNVTDFPIIKVHVDELSSPRNYSLPIKVYYHICTVRHIRIEIIHESQNVFWILTWVGRILVNFIRQPMLKLILASMIYFLIKQWLCTKDFYSVFFVRLTWERSWIKVP